MSFPLLEWLRKFFLGISPEEATFARRGFRGDGAESRLRLEEIGHTFLQGYHIALEENKPETLGFRLDEVDAELRGFAFEGAAMGLALLDFLTPWRRKEKRVQIFLKGSGVDHVYMIHIGIGWAVARLPWHRACIERSIEQLDPLLRWLAVDGYGFHEGYFYWRFYVEKQTVPKGLFNYSCRAFDQGLGRSLWFVEGANVNRISRTINVFLPARHADLWSGVGLACTYAGGVDRTVIKALKTAAEHYGPHLGQGAAFAAKARQRAGNSAPHTELACEVLCGMSAHAAAKITDAALEGLPPDGKDPAYEVWRGRIRAQFMRL